MDRIYFSFGPGTAYFYYSPKAGWTSNGFPQAAYDKLKQDGYTRIHLVVMNDRKHWVVTFDNRKGVLCQHGAFAPDGNIMKWWKQNRSELQQQKLAATLGHSGRYFIQAENIPGSCVIPAEPAKLISGVSGRRPKLVALGVGESAFFILWGDGGWTWNHGNQYGELNQILKGLKRGDIEYLALNPYRAKEFFLVLRSEKVIFLLHNSLTAEVNKVLQKEGVSSQVIARQSHFDNNPQLPQAMVQKDFVKGITGGSKILLAGVNLAASVIGICSAMCTVM